MTTPTPAEFVPCTNPFCHHGETFSEHGTHGGTCLRCNGTGKLAAPAPAEFVMVPRDDLEALAENIEWASKENSCATLGAYAKDVRDWLAAPTSPVMAAGVTDEMVTIARAAVRALPRGAGASVKYRAALTAALAPLLAQLSGLSGEVERLREEVAEETYIRERLAQLLAGVTLAVKGEPAPLHAHSYHDLPEVCARLVEDYRKLHQECCDKTAAESERDTLRAKLEAAESLLREARNFVAVSASVESVLPSPQNYGTPAADFLARIDAALSAHSGGK